MYNKIVCFFLVTTFIVFSSCKNRDANLETPSNPSATNPGENSIQPEIKVIPTDQPEVTNGKLTEMVFTEEEFDFGIINQGDKVNHIFTFKNTGKNDLVISRAMGSCGCTIPEYPKAPILPGKTGVMKVSFNSKGKKGDQHKTVSVYANVPKGGVTLAIKAKIKV